MVILYNKSMLKEDIFSCCWCYDSVQLEICVL
jgi:hypothetical protein